MKSFLRFARIGYGPLIVSGVLLLFLVSAFPQSSSRNVNGRWVWKEIARNNKPQRQFRIVIRQDGNALKGIYSVDEFINGEWQGEDGNQTPFIGNLKGNQMQIEFDPLATEPGYEQNVSYVAPSNGRKPSLAVITRTGSNLRWRVVRGPGIRGVPKNIVLKQERRRDRARF
jgi:hypothetical protein